MRVKENSSESGEAALPSFPPEIRQGNRGAGNGIVQPSFKIGLPESRVHYTVLRSPHIDKKSREQFEMEIKKEFLVIKTERHELRKKFFRLKRRATRRT